MTRISPRLLVCALVAASAATALLQSQSLELKPGYISGTVTIGGATINSLQINASSGSLSANSSHTTGSYTTLVNVPAGTTPTYTVRPTVYTDASFDYFQLPTKTVTVIEGLTSLLDFVDAPGYISGSVAVQNGSVTTRLHLRTRPLGHVVRRIQDQPNPQLAVHVSDRHWDCSRRGNRLFHQQHIGHHSRANDRHCCSGGNADIQHDRFGSAN